MTRINCETTIEETLQILHKGDIFGDTEVLEQTFRVATVTTVTSVTLWSVDGQEFKNAMTLNLEPCDAVRPYTADLTYERASSSIRTRADDQFEEIPSTLQRSVTSVSEINQIKFQGAQNAIYRFLANLTWFDNLNSAKFLEDTKAATLVYYQNNKSIVQSSHGNDHLYFVKDGYCEVITRVTIEKASIKSNKYNSYCYDTGMTFETPKSKRKLRPTTGVIRNQGGGSHIDSLSRPKTAPSVRHEYTKTSDIRIVKPDEELKPPSTITKFLKVCRLNQGDVFGITSLFDKNELETSLVFKRM